MLKKDVSTLTNNADLIDNGIRIGVYVDKSGNGAPPHFIDREAHRKFVENIMATSPYGPNYNK